LDLRYSNALWNRIVFCAEIGTRSGKNWEYVVPDLFYGVMEQPQERVIYWRHTTSKRFTNVAYKKVSEKCLKK